MASEPLIVGYAGLDPDRPKRPGLVTAFGVASIVIGTFGVMFGLLCGGQTLLMHALPTAFAFGGGQPNVSRVNAVEAQTVVAGLNAVSPMAPAEAELLERVFPHVDLPLAEPADGVWTEAHVSSQLTIPGNFGRPVATQPTTRAGAALTGTPRYYSTNSGGINAFGGGSVSIWGQGNFTTATLESDGTISVDQPGAFF
ncbi:MAG: hypothetical protein AAF561_16525, partial [Planctomycetota bacterium]